MAFGSNDVEIKVKVDAQGAIQVFDSLGKKVDELSTKSTEGERSTSFLSSAFEKLKSPMGAAIAAAATLATSFISLKTIELGDSINDASEALDRLAGQAGTTADVILNKTNEALGGTVDRLTLMQSANLALTKGLKPEIFDEVAFAAKRYADATGTDAAGAIDTFVQAITRGRESQLKQLGLLKDGKIQLEAYSRAQLDAAESNKGLADILETLKVRLQDAFGKFAAAIDSSELFRSTLRSLGGAVVFILEKLSSLAVGLIKLADGAFKVIRAEVEKVKNGFLVLGELWNQIAKGELPNLTKAFAAVNAQKLSEHLAKEIEIVGDAISLDLPKKAKEGVDKVKKEMESLADLLRKIGTDKLTENFEPQFKKIVDAFKEGTLTIEQTQAAATEFYDILISAGVPAEEAISRIAAAFSKVEKESKKAQKGFASGFLGFDPNDPELFNNTLDSAGQGLAQIITSAFSGDKGSIKNALRGAGAKIGSNFGIIGEALGDALGKGVFDAFNHVFGGRDAQGKIRDSLDKLFADALKDNPLQAIIDGQLQSITDLTFGKGTNAFVDGSFDDAFQSMGESAQRAFQGIATGFTGVLGQGEDLSSQLAAIFANNLGGSLNNLQLLVEATGKSFEDLRKGVVESFLDGKLSALEAQTALIGIQQISEKGIPGALGAVSEAFNNLKAAGVKGGRALIDALQDVGFEARELGIKDLAGVQAHLAATGQFSADEIQKVFDALKASGIDSIDKLTGATAEQLIPVLSQLQAATFPFAEATEKIGDLAEKLNSLPERIDTTVHVNFVATGDQTAKNIIGQQAGIAL